MKTRRFYAKTYEHPAKRYSHYWNIDERFLHNASNFIFGGGLKPRHAIIYLRDVSGKEISRNSMARYIEACFKWQMINRLHLKRTQRVSSEVARDSIKRGVSVNKKDAEIDFYD